jgi:CheY-like chemotaxis protein
MLSKRKILVTDDEAMARRLARRMLEDEYEVAEAASGLEALSQLDKERFDLLLTDCEMVGMNGVELVKRAMDLYSDLACVVVSGNLTAARREELDEHKVPYLEKPYKMAALKKLVRQALSRVNPD